MEYHLLNSYLKYQKDHSVSFTKAIKKIPWYIIVLLIFAILCLAASIISVFVAGVNEWFYAFTFAEAIIAFTLYWVQERWEIKYSREHYNDFKTAAHDLYNWLSEYSITTKEDIELIKLRLTNDMEKQDALKRQQSDKIDKWMQTLVIPLILAIITTFISNQTDIESVVGYVFSLLAIAFLVYAIVWIIRSVYGLLNSRKRNNIELFVDDLQSVIDVMFVFAAKDNSK